MVRGGTGFRIKRFVNVACAQASSAPEICLTLLDKHLTDLTFHLGNAVT